MATDVDEVVGNAFNVGKMLAKYATYAALVEPYATTEISGYTFLNSSADFQVAIGQLNSPVSERATAVSNYLNN